MTTAYYEPAISKVLQPTRGNKIIIGSSLAPEVTTQRGFLKTKVSTDETRKGRNFWSSAFF